MSRDQRKNAEGYIDLTAYYAIERADRDLERKRNNESNNKNKKIYKKTYKKKKSKKNFKKMEETR